jgi:hypothetical protein
MIQIELDALLRTWVPSHEPGVAVALLKGDQVLHCQGYGMARHCNLLPVTPLVSMRNHNSFPCVPSGLLSILRHLSTKSWRDCSYT